MPRVTFLPDGLTLDCADGESVFELARKNGLMIDTACVGKGSCGLCRVKIIAGEEWLPPFSKVETRHLGNVYFLTKVRLSCCCVVRGGDVTVEIINRVPTGAR
jgi:ferredoxin